MRPMLMILMLTIIAMAVSPLNAAAGSVTVTGTVTDTTGVLALRNATVQFIAGTDTVRAVTDSTGRYELTLATTATAVAADDTPSGIMLLQNYPNPFNPATTIPFEFETPAQVRLDIHAITGQRIRKLADDVYGPGRHSVRWDGRDDHGAPVAAGVYFCRLIAGEYTSVRKMLLLDGGHGLANGVSLATPISRPAAIDTAQYTVVIEKTATGSTATSRCRFCSMPP